MTPSRTRSVAFFALLFLLMVGVIVWASFQRSIFADLGPIWALPWGRVTVVDLYIGFAIFLAFVWARERSLPKLAGWTVALATLGNVASAAYLLWALYRLPPDATAADLLRPRPRE